MREDSFLLFLSEGVSSIIDYRPFPSLSLHCQLLIHKSDRAFPSVPSISPMDAPAATTFSNSPLFHCAGAESGNLISNHQINTAICRFDSSVRRCPRCDFPLPLLCSSLRCPSGGQWHGSFGSVQWTVSTLLSDDAQKTEH